jgi:predicted Rossmann fold nucleotide-binding protein DprA/Smf involved in DNA uptake
MNYYAGIGSRQTPEDVLKIMKTIGSFMVHKDYILRSGAADGADTAFEQGCDAENGKKKFICLGLDLIAILQNCQHLQKKHSL